ncbi:glycerol kinase GlpK [Gammaproteobacteria bacterium]|nr:glycerol kinase GlpK [Gammaproteobacteria bacterium]MDB4850690.1 glycerol kinase GlpK [Gammaproteobacteria bacterium]MDC0885438.1 glycerol kinase GlpK [Gammaproteobacteria bacterium]
MPTLIAIDQGTTSTRTVAFDADLNIIHSKQKEYPLIYPNDGWVEIEPEELMNSVYSTIDPVLEACSDVSALGITNQRETTLVWDSDSGKPIYNAIVWQDRRTAEQCMQLKKDGYEETIKNATGLLLDPYFSATKISWILNNVDGARQKADAGKLRFGTVDTYLLWQLTDGNVYKTDVTNASRTNLYNIHTKEWDSELLKIFNIPKSMLPEVFPSESHYGSFDRGNKTIKITGIIGDQQGALVGQRCFQPGQMKATFGTGCFLMVNSGNEYLQSTSGLLNTLGYGLSGSVPYALEGSIFSAGTIIQWLRDNLEFFSDSAESINLLDERGESNGVLFIPGFTGIGAPHWNAEIRASFYGITRDTTKTDMVTAAFKSLIYQVMDIKEALSIDGIEIKNLSIDGGMAANSSFCQLLSDFLGQEVQVPPSLESTAIGAAIAAGIGAHLFSIENLQNQQSNDATIYRPREKVFIENDLIEWRKFLKALLDAYN